MINLLPPPIKQQIRFARFNRLALRYFRLVVLVLVVLGAVFGASIFFLNQQVDTLAQDVTEKRQAIAGLEPNFKKAKEISERLTAIKSIRTTQTRFSALLNDLAQVLPRGVALDSITLTGDDRKPVRVSVTGNTYHSILAFRESLAASPRINGVDLENINQTEGGFQASVVIGFKPGQAK